MDGSEKITSGLVIAGCDGSELLKLAKEILNEMSCPVQVLVIKPLVRTMAFRRDNRSLAGWSYSRIWTPPHLQTNRFWRLGTTAHVYSVSDCYPFGVDHNGLFAR